jgi:ABC-type multidrug transport system ATPase subunit
VFLTTHYMDEADRVAHRSGIIDHDKIVLAEAIVDAFWRAFGLPGRLARKGGGL